MARLAKTSTGKLIKAEDVKITEIREIFCCRTPGCPAKMSIVNAGNIHKAFFRRLPSSPNHISSACQKRKLTFTGTKYEEKKFNKDDFFAWVFKQPNSQASSGTKSKNKKIKGKKRGIRTLASIYSMCVNHKKTDLYNGYMIGDMFADEENYPKYRNNLKGYLIVECSYFKKVYGENAILFNYPKNYKNNHDILKVEFDDKQTCDKYKRKLKDTTHKKPIIIAGNWNKAPRGSIYQSSCKFYSGRQIYIVK